MVGVKVMVDVNVRVGVNVTEGVRVGVLVAVDVDVEVVVMVWVGVNVKDFAVSVSAAFVLVKATFSKYVQEESSRTNKQNIRMRFICGYCNRQILKINSVDIIVRKNTNPGTCKEPVERFHLE